MTASPGARRSPYARPCAQLLLGASAAWAAIASLAAAACASLAAPHLTALAFALGVGGLACGALGWLHAGVLTRGANHRRWVAGFSLAIAGSALAALAIVWPPGASDPDRDLLRSRFLPGFAPSGPWLGRVPEVEVVRVGASVGLMPAEVETGWNARGFDATYDEIAAAHDLDPATSWVVDAWAFDRGHYLVARPPGVGPFPLLLVLHGSGGPFQFLPHALVRAAVERGFVVALPTWGLCTPQAGRTWWTESGRRRVLDVVDALAAERLIDARRVVLAGLSAGGIGSADILAHHPDRFVGGVLISGVPPWPFDPARLRGVPLFIVHGDHDARLPLRLATELADRTRAARGTVELDVIPGDHFILITHREAIVRRALDWSARLVAR